MGGFLIGDLVVAATEKLDHAEAVTEGIDHVSNVPPAVGLDCPLSESSGLLRPRRRDVDVGHHDVEMHRRPMSAIIAPLIRGRDGSSSRLLDEQIKDRRRAQQLDAPRAETPPNRQAKRIAVERDRFFQIVDVDIDEQFSHSGHLLQRGQGGEIRSDLVDDPWSWRPAPRPLRRHGPRAEADLFRPAY
jgi:hypothetical protein